MQNKTVATPPPDFLVHQPCTSPAGGPKWSSALVGVAWRCPDGTFEIQFSTKPATGLVKLSPHNTARRGNHAT